MTLSNSTSWKDANSNTNNEKKQVAVTQVLYGEKDSSDLFKKIFLDCRHTCCIYCDRNEPSLIFKVPSYTELYTVLKNNNIRIRFITEITTGNINFCKKIIQKFGAEIKHLKGAKGNFIISDNKEFVSANSEKKTN